jgi:hypothetical protein
MSEQQTALSIDAELAPDAYTIRVQGASPRSLPSPGGLPTGLPPRSALSELLYVVPGQSAALHGKQHFGPLEVRIGGRSETRGVQSA